jgi:hypothetical protein
VSKAPSGSYHRNTAADTVEGRGSSSLFDQIGRWRATTTPLPRSARLEPLHRATNRITAACVVIVEEGYGSSLAGAMPTLRVAEGPPLSRDDGGGAAAPSHRWAGTGVRAFRPRWGCHADSTNKSRNYLHSMGRLDETWSTSGWHQRTRARSERRGRSSKRAFRSTEVRRRSVLCQRTLTTTHR